MRRTGVALVAVLVALGIGPAALGDDSFGGALGFLFQADLNGDGIDEAIVGVQARGADTIAEFTDPGDVYVLVRDEFAAPRGSFTKTFSARSVVPEELAPWFFDPSVVAVDDVDADGLVEVVLVWLEQFWWPGARRPLAILQYDPAQATYGMIFDTRLAVSEIGGYATEDVDADGLVEIIQIDPVYGSTVDPVTGEEEGECHFCPHRYQLEVFEFDGAGFVVDPQFNGGEPFVTPDKFEPGLGGDRISAFLPELMDYVRGLLRPQ